MSKIGEHTVGDVYLSDKNGETIIFSGIFSIKDNLSSRMIGSPVESGRTVFDNKIWNPDTIEIEGVVLLSGVYIPSSEDNVNYAPLLSEMRGEELVDKLFKIEGSRSYETYTICTKYGARKNFVCERLTCSCVKDKFDAIEVSMSFKELITADVAYREYEGISRQTTVGKNPSNRDNRDTIRSGAKAINSLEGAAASGALLGLSGLASWGIGGIIGKFMK